MIPVLETPHLILRHPVPADFPDYAALMASPRSVGMGGPFDERQAWGLFCHEIACWQLFGHGGLTITLRRPRGSRTVQVEIRRGDTPATRGAFEYGEA